MQQLYQAWDNQRFGLWCWSGALSAVLFKSGVSNLVLHGVDTSPTMAAVARTHLAQQGLPIQTRTQDVRSLPYATDNAFGMVMAAHTIEHLPQPQVEIEEMVLVVTARCPTVDRHDATKLASIAHRSAMGLIICYFNVGRNRTIKTMRTKIMKAIICTEYGPPDVLQLREYR